MRLIISGPQGSGKTVLANEKIEELKRKIKTLNVITGDADNLGMLTGLAALSPQALTAIVIDAATESQVKETIACFAKSNFKAIIICTQDDIKIERRKEWQVLRTGK